MNESESLVLQGLKIAVDTLAVEIAKQRLEAAERGRNDGLPEWLDLKQAVALKRGAGASMNTYKQRPRLQPRCGLHYKMIGGRRCWKKEDVIAWLEITDERLDGYAQTQKG
jgi:hypothetical protein